jgi:predicted porin
MKQKILALAVVTALVPLSATAADFAVYGRAHLSFDSVDTGDDVNDGGMHVASNSSRLGFRVSADVAGLKASAQVETGVSWGTDSTATWGASRDSFVGLAGDFGSVKIGRLGWANQYVYDVNYFGDQVGDAGIFLENGTPGGRRDQQIQYSTPSMGGFAATLSFVPENSNADVAESDVGIRLTYAGGPFAVAVTRLETGSDSVADENITNAIGATYSFAMGQVGLALVTGKDAGVDKPDVMTVGASINVGPGAVKAQYTKADSDVANSSADMFAVGYDHPLSKEVTVYVAYAKASNDANAAFSVTGYGKGDTVGGVTAGRNPSAISFGLVASFM